MDLIELPNLRVLKAKLPDDLYSKILDECLHCEENNKKFKTGLSADGIPAHYLLKNTKYDFFNFLRTLINKWFEAHPYYIKNHYTILNKDCYFYIDEPWINIQQKNEFLPIHKHDGILSYSMWIKIPNIENKEKFYSFQFVYSSVVGMTYDYDLQLSKKDEGTIFLFPSMLNHIVSPFHSSNEKRISISGNIKMKVE
tara:strand:+ start:63 stop:653 length:591 start_codon:yes stop_codon:yes gene_type:complete